MCGQRVVIVSHHHDYARRCPARRGCVHSRRNLVLVGTPDRAGQHGLRHRCLGWVSLVSRSTIGARPRLGLPQALHGQHERNAFKRDHGTFDSVGVSPFIPRLLEGMPRHRRRRQRASTRRPRFRQNGRGIMSVLAKAYKIGDKLGRDKRYKRMGAKGATGHYRRHPRPWES